MESVHHGVGGSPLPIPSLCTLQERREKKKKKDEKERRKGPKREPRAKKHFRGIWKANADGTELRQERWQNLRALPRRKRPAALRLTNGRKNRRLPKIGPRKSELSRHVENR